MAASLGELIAFVVAMALSSVGVSTAPTGDRAPRPQVEETALRLPGALVAPGAAIWSVTIGCTDADTGVPTAEVWSS
ncbi:MAG: hypothetical protein MI723_16345 [Caulobacterales bacterium]|nr:hypothetical protein [Caulobacterales bacterium]